MHVFVGHAVYISFCMASKCFLYCSSSLKVRKITTVLIIAIIKCFFISQVDSSNSFFFHFIQQHLSNKTIMINCKYFTHKKEAEKNSCFNLGRFVTKVARRLFLRLIIRLCTIWTFKECQVIPQRRFLVSYIDLVMMK